MIHKNYAGFDVNLRDNGVCVVTFIRPEHMNGLSRAIKRDLTELAVQIAFSSDVRVVVLNGGENFSAGDDLTRAGQDKWDWAKSEPVKTEGHGSLSTYSRLRAISQQMTRAWRDLDVLTIAAMDGFAIQSGFSLALACDFRIATRRARLGSATLRMGYLPDEGGHYLLVQYLGVAKAKEFLFRNRIVGADEALALGLVTEVVETEDLMPRALAVADELAAGPQTAMRLLKNSLESAARLTFEQACMDIAVRTAISDHHPDAKEGREAFLARPRRNPKFE